MNFKYFAIVVLFASFAWGCQQNTGNEKGKAESEGPEQQEQEEANQAQQNAGQFQPGQQGGEVSDEDLQQFVAVSQQMQIINQKAQQNMIQALQDEGLEAQRYTEIQQSQQDPNQEANASDEEMVQFEAATQELQKIQIDAQQQMQEMLKAEGLTQNRYQQISMSLQSDPELQQKMRALQQQAQ